jgi:hypothetical protein
VSPIYLKSPRIFVVLRYHFGFVLRLVTPQAAFVRVVSTCTNILDLSVTKCPVFRQNRKFSEVFGSPTDAFRAHVPM